jgi:hypothetical protein
MKLKSTVVAGLLTASMAVPVFANEAVLTPLPQFTAHDAQMLFEQDAKPMQLAALSQQEMKETEGEWIWFFYAAAPTFYWTANWMNASGWRVIPSVWHRVRQW